MKKILLLIFVCLSSVIYSQTWVLQTSNVSLNLQKIFFVDSLHGWSVGSSGTIVRTLDGGNNWLVANSGVSASLNGVHFISPAVGWAVGNVGAILKTVNGGNSWSSQNSTTTNSLCNVFFIDSLNGWCNDTYFNIYKTSNSGATWTQYFTGLSCGINGFVEFAFTSPTNGFYLTGCGNISSNIAQTVDGGLNWTGLPPSISLPKAISFAANKRDGYILPQASVPGNTGLITSDSGHTWTLLPIPIGNFQTSGVSCISSSTAFVSGGYGNATGNVFRTTNSGQSWSATFTSTTATKNSVCFPQENYGWCCDADGNIWRWDNSSATVSTPISYLCKGFFANIPFNVQGNFANGNIFRLFLSNHTGNFSNATQIDSLITTASGIFHPLISTSLIDDTGYKLRITGTNPPYSQDYDSSITIETITGNFAASQTLLTYPQSTAQFNNTSVNPNWNYTWLFGDGTSPYSSNNVTVYHPYSNNGLYDVSLVITNAGGCSDTVTKAGYIYVAGVPTNINNTLSDDFKIYPNPSTDKIILSFTNSSKEQIELKLFDMCGHLFQQETIEYSAGTNTKQIKLDQFPKGIYVLQIKTGEHLINKKLEIH